MCEQISLKQMVMKDYVACILVMTIAHFNTILNAQPCRLTSPSNMIVKADAGKEGATVEFAPVNNLGSGDCGTITYTPASGSFFRIGSHSIIVTTSEGQKSFFTLTVTDNEPPALSPITLSSQKLSARNKIKTVTVHYTASDNAENVTTVLTIRSNDTESNKKDWEIVNSHLIRLKASTLPSGTPRIYTITVTCTDEAGNTTTRTTSVTVSDNGEVGYAKAG